MPSGVSSGLDLRANFLITDTASHIPRFRPQQSKDLLWPHVGMQLPRDSIHPKWTPLRRRRGQELILAWSQRGNF
jgi:hypothetical protein